MDRNTRANDTIAAIATGPGEAGISIIRVSGPDSYAIADAVFRCKGDRPSRRPAGTFVYGQVTTNAGAVSGDSGDTLDEAILLIYRAPHSYTREDAVEIQCHGGTIAARRVLRCVLDAGARLADPGEFTKRAFLSGRIDLLQAEAVLDLIRARSDHAAAMAVRQLEGSLTTLIDSVYDDIVAVVSDLEASLDFPEDELPPTVLPEIRARIGSVRARMDGIIAGWDEGRILREGILVVIAGKPNSGKSSLFNRLLGSDRSIVTPIPGTTRDTIEEVLSIDGFSVRLVDTAGLRSTSCEIEQEGIRRAIDQIESSDICMYILDAQRVIDSCDNLLIGDMDPLSSIVVINKIDLASCVALPDLPGRTVVRTSMTSGDGMSDLLQALREKIRSFRSMENASAISERHREAIAAATRLFGEAEDMLSTQRDDLIVPTIAAIRHGLDAIAALTGRIYQEDILNGIFSRFCIGK